DAATCDAMAEYGLQLGYAFQIADDVLDYTADAEALGKNLGDDLAEGKATLPLIHAMAHSDDATRAELRRIVETGDSDAMPVVLDAIQRCGSIDYARQQAIRYADRAEAALAVLPGGAAPDRRFREALVGLARYAIDRQF